MKYVRAEFLYVTEGSINICLGAQIEGKRTLDGGTVAIIGGNRGLFIKRLTDDKYQVEPYTGDIVAMKYHRAGKMGLQML